MRLLGGIETALWRFSQSRPFNVVAIGRIAGPLEPAVLRRALDALQARHPLLRVRISASPRPTFATEGVPAIPLRVMDRLRPDHWQREAQEELNTSLPLQDGPLIRALLLYGDVQHELILTLDHVITDGYSCGAIMFDVLDAAASVMRGEAPAPIPLPLRPTLEELLPAETRRARRQWRAMKLGGEWISSILRQEIHEFPSTKKLDSRPIRTQLAHMELDADITTRVRRRCRTEGTTVHGALCAALMTAAAVHVQMHKGNSAPVDIGCGSAINIRALLEPQVAMFEVGFYATGIYTLAQVGKDSSFWKLACLVTKHVQALYKSGEVCAITQAIGLLGLRTEVPAVPQRPTGSAFLGTVGVTDGAAPPGFPVQYGPFVLERGHCAVSMNLLEAVPILAVVTLDGRMQLNLTVSSSIDGALAQTLLTQFRSIILSECGITA